MAKIIVNLDEFFDMVPLFILTAFQNEEFLNDTALDFFSDIEKKVLPMARQYYLKSNPDLRRKLKFILRGIEGGQNTTITIKGDTSKPNENRERKYLTESWEHPIETAKTYLKGS